MTISDDLVDPLELHFRTVFGELVTLTTSGKRSTYGCDGCGFKSTAEDDSGRALQAANSHAASCHSTRDPNGRIDLLKSIADDVRSELPRIDTRAAASIALAAAVLVGAVQLTPSRMPAFAFGVAGCAILTMSLLFASTVLLPSAVRAHRGLDRSAVRMNSKHG